MSSTQDIHDIEVVVKGLKVTADHTPPVAATPTARPVNYHHRKLGDLGIYVMSDVTNTNDVIRDLVGNDDVIDVEKPIFCTDLDDVIDNYNLWKEELPQVDVFYALKTYDSPVILQLLSNLGCGIEIASKTEAEHCLNLGVKPERIICNHPYKLGPHLEYFSASNIRIVSVDSPDELDKVARILPEAELLVRIVPATDKCDEGFHFDVKFGATENQAQELLKYGLTKGLNFVGVAFHVGSATKDPTVHQRSLEAARGIFDFAKSLGYDMTILDIGGGFPGGRPTEFRKICAELRPALEENFPSTMNVRIIAEPGRFFATSAVTTYACVIGRRQISKWKLEKTVSSNPSTFPDHDDQNAYIYVINDGVWGSMNYIFAEADYQPLKILNPRLGVPKTPCIIWGPTCDSLDRVTGMTDTPILEVGDWVYRTDGGAYAHTLRGNFNGMPHPRYVFTISDRNLHFLERGGGIKMPYV